jgi:hypothetical protein
MITIGTGIGSARDIVDRVRRLIPHKWFIWGAPFRDAILGGLADLSSWCYYIVAYARSQSRLATAYGIWLDIFAYDFVGTFLLRNKIADDGFRAVIKATILQERVTRKGMINAITMLTSNVPTIFEPWNTFDTGAYSSPNGVGVPRYGSFGYNVGQGGYGNMILNDQVFIKIERGGGSGIPNVDGYGNPIAGYGSGAIEYLGPSSELYGITDTIIYQIVNMTKPTGTTMWVAFIGSTFGLTSESGILLKDETATNILVSQ